MCRLVLLPREAMRMWLLEQPSQRMAVLVTQLGCGEKKRKKEGLKDHEFFFLLGCPDKRLEASRGRQCKQLEFARDKRVCRPAGVVLGSQGSLHVSMFYQNG